MNIEIGGLYCIDDSYFERYSNSTTFKWVLRNHTNGRTDGLGHRPHVIALQEPRNKDFYWAVPLAHDVEKYQGVYDHKVETNGFCDNIAFVRILGKNEPSAALAQNMIPVTKEYIEKPYAFVSSGKPRELSADDQKMVLSMARKTLTKHRAGIRSIRTPVDAIYENLKMNSVVALGIEALKATPLAARYVLVKETPSGKTTVAVLGGQSASFDDLKLVRIDERPGEDTYHKIVPITAPRFAHAIKELGTIQWTQVIPRKEQLFESSAINDRSGFDAALDKAEKNATRSAEESSAHTFEKSKNAHPRNPNNQR